MAVKIANYNSNIRQLSCNEFFLSAFLVSWWIRAHFPQFSLSVVSYNANFWRILWNCVGLVFMVSDRQNLLKNLHFGGMSDAQ